MNKLSGELIQFLTKPKFWADFGHEYPGVVGSEHAHWRGHFHGHLNTLRAILDYAVATNDSRLKQFVRDGYEWTRQGRLPRIGFVGDGQGCGHGRLIGLAVKMSKAGVRDYWEDVDQYIRNQAVEYQLTEPDMLEYWSKAEKEPLPAGQLTQVMRASIGAVCGDPFKTGWGLCCTSHGNMAFFYGWDGALQYDQATVRINLLMNRASTLRDVDSYLPYEGKVVLKNKKARQAYVRIPLWADTSLVQCSVNGTEQKSQWFGRYLHLVNLQAKDRVVIEFPVSQRNESWTTPGKVRSEWPGWDGTIQRRIRFRGNTVIGMSHPILPYSPLYQGRPEKYKTTKAPVKKVKRYVSQQRLTW